MRKPSIASSPLQINARLAAPARALLFVVLLAAAAAGFTLPGAGRPARAGENTPASLSYVALGDSLTAKAGYAPEHSTDVAADLNVPVTFTNLGLIGYTSGGLLSKLTNDQTFRDAVTNANLITVMIGINDIGLASFAYAGGTCGGPDNQDCIRNTESYFSHNFTNIISQIRTLNTKNAAIFALDIYNPGIQSQTNNGTLDVYVPFFEQINASIHSISAANGIPVAGVYQAFNGASGLEDPMAKGYISPDGVHANDDGHHEIAAVLRTLDSGLEDWDADQDGLTIAEERATGTDPFVSDTDGDGCSDGREVGPDHRKGGQRDPNNPWDYFNPTRDGHVRVDDIILVYSKYYKDAGNPGYSQATDRTLAGPNAWNLGPPDGKERMDDVLNVLHQFFDDCG